jgi:hypothetical protein
LDKYSQVDSLTNPIALTNLAVLEETRATATAASHRASETFFLQAMLQKIEKWIGDQGTLFQTDIPRRSDWALGSPKIWTRDLLFTKATQEQHILPCLISSQPCRRQQATKQSFNNPLYDAIFGSEWHAQHVKTHAYIVEFVEAVKQALPFLYNSMWGEGKSKESKSKVMGVNDNSLLQLLASIPQVHGR